MAHPLQSWGCLSLVSSRALMHASREISCSHFAHSHTLTPTCQTSGWRQVSYQLRKVLFPLFKIQHCQVQTFCFSFFLCTQQKCFSIMNCCHLHRFGQGRNHRKAELLRPQPRKPWATTAETWPCPRPHSWAHPRESQMCPARKVLGSLCCSSKVLDILVHVSQK